MGKLAKALLALVAVVACLVGLLYDSNIIIAKVTRENFAGGKISAWESVVELPAGTGTTWGIFWAGGEEELTLTCADGRQERAGYMEGGPLQYISVTVSECRIDDPGVARYLALTPFDLVPIDWLITDKPARAPWSSPAPSS